MTVTTCWWHRQLTEDRFLLAHGCRWFSSCLPGPMYLVRTHRDRNMEDSLPHSRQEVERNSNREGPGQDITPSDITLVTCFLPPDPIFWPHHWLRPHTVPEPSWSNYLWESLHGHTQRCASLTSQAPASQSSWQSRLPLTQCCDIPAFSWLLSVLHCQPLSLHPPLPSLSMPIPLTAVLGWSLHFYQMAKDVLMVFFSIIIYETFLHRVKGFLGGGLVED